MRYCRLLLVLVLCAGCGTDAERARVPAAAHTATLPAGGESSDPADFERCPFPRLRPAYLPWLRPGEEVRAPSADKSWGYASLSWFAEGSRLGWKPRRRHGHVLRPYLDLRRYTSPGASGPGKAVNVMIAGVPGELYESAQPGAGAIVWVTKAGRCNAIAIELETFRRLSQAETERALRKVAASLRP